MDVPYIFRKIQLQGQDSADNWVTSFAITYRDDNLDWKNFAVEGFIPPVNCTNSSCFYSINGTSDRNTITERSFEPPIYAQHLRIHPLTWNNSPSLRFELIGCQQEEKHFHDVSCKRCEATWYCLGDGIKRPCGRCSENEACNFTPTEHSFGMASECTFCPKGWVCKLLVINLDNFIKL